jgi:hypothetical protein
VGSRLFLCCRRSFLHFRPQRQCLASPHRRLTLQSRGQTTAGQACSLRLHQCRRCLPLISNVSHQPA